MKRLSILMIFFFVCYIIYYDLQIGTLPVLNKTSIAQQATTDINNNSRDPQGSYYEHTVKQGDTVLSITEKYHGTLPISIDRLVQDFEDLNPNVKAEEISIGTSYLFPDYKQ